MKGLKIVGICIAQLVGGPCLGPVGLVSWGYLIGATVQNAILGPTYPWFQLFGGLLVIQTAGFLFGIVVWYRKLRREVRP